LPRTPTPTSDLITPPPKPASEEEWVRRSVSPDGVWIAEERWNPHSDRETFKIFNASQSKSWTLVNRDVRLGDYQPELLGWSSDSRHFYYRRLGSDEAGEGKCEPFGVKADLRMYCFDVGTGATKLISLPEGTEHAISPDEGKLAYISAKEPPKLVIRDMKSGTEHTFTIPASPSLPQMDKSAAGAIVWSPGGTDLVFSVATFKACDESGLSLSSAVMKLDLRTNSFHELTAFDTGLVCAGGWPVEERILIGEWNGSTWWIDAATGEVSEAPTIEE
jgi:hypothetical protein